MSERALARKAFAALLNNALVGTGLPAQAVYDHRPADFGQQSPVVAVSSAGSLRSPKTFRGSRPVFYIDVFVFVLYATADKTWTEAMTESALDDIEEIVGGVVAANQSGAHWSAITQDERSVTGSVEIEAVNIGGVEYRREVIPLRFE